MDDECPRRPSWLASSYHRDSASLLNVNRELNRLQCTPSWAFVAVCENSLSFILVRKMGLVAIIQKILVISISQSRAAVPLAKRNVRFGQNNPLALSTRCAYHPNMLFPFRSSLTVSIVTLAGFLCSVATRASADCASNCQAGYNSCVSQANNNYNSCKTAADQQYNRCHSNATSELQSCQSGCNQTKNNCIQCCSTCGSIGGGGGSCQCNGGTSNCAASCNAAAAGCNAGSRICTTAESRAV